MPVVHKGRSIQRLILISKRRKIRKGLYSQLLEDGCDSGIGAVKNRKYFFPEIAALITYGKKQRALKGIWIFPALTKISPIPKPKTSGTVINKRVQIKIVADCKKKNLYP